ncbi:MAG: lysophospholipid acyltransferase family protein [Victivallaceae bacterium]|nr:lysophospholipid acyltransferase family protein [Victivallaceae bacterium]
MIPDFCKDSYDTSGDRRDWLTRFSLGSRFNFHFRIYYNFYRIGCCAKKGLFERRHQALFGRANADVIERCGGQIHIRGMENLTCEAGPFVIAGNHMSAIETILLNSIISPRMDYTFVIKQGLFSVPFMRQAMLGINAIGVQQINPREDFKIIMTEGANRINAGKSVLIFPEASRCSEFRPERFNTIAVKLAKKCGVKVIPFALKTDFLTFGKLIRECGPVHPKNEIYIEFGEPIEVSGNGHDAQSAIIDFIQTRTRKWSNLTTYGAKA